MDVEHETGNDASRLREVLAHLPGELEKQVERLEEITSEFNSFDLIAWVGVDNLLIDPDRYTGGSYPGSAARVEYLTLLCLTKAFNAGTAVRPTPERFEEIRELLDRIFAWIIWTGTIRDLTSGKLPDDLDQLARSMRVHELMVRNPGFLHHQEQILHGLFSPFDGPLKEKLGFTVGEAMTIMATVKTSLQNKLQDRIDWALDGYKQLERFVRAKRKGRSAAKPEGVPDDLLKALMVLPERDLRKSTRQMALAAAAVALGDVLPFGTEELAGSSGLEGQVVASFLRRFSIGFGDVPEEFRFPEPVHPLKHRPVVQHNSKYLCPVPDGILWALQPALEAALKDLGRTWHRYEQHRHGYLIEEALRLMKRVMPSCDFERNVVYPDPNSTKGHTVELDAVGVYDSAVFLMEAKGGGLRSTTRAGKRLSFKDQMEDLLTKAHTQSLRARDYLEATDELRFLRARDGASVNIEKVKLSRIYLVSVTLEPLGHLTALMDVESPFTASPEEPLWTVSLLDLMVIADCLEGYQPWLPHYVGRRMRILKQGFFKSVDELDLFVYYLERGLYFESAGDLATVAADVQGEFNIGYLDDMTDVLDRYYWHQREMRRKASPRPVPRVSDSVRRFVERLDRSGLPGRLDAIMRILDLNEVGRKRFIQGVRGLYRKSKRDGKLHDFSMAGPHGGISCFLANESSGTANRMQSYISYKREEMGVETWIGIAVSPAKEPWYVGRVPASRFTI
jgi:hypothetical protein